MHLFSIARCQDRKDETGKSSHVQSYCVTHFSFFLAATNDFFTSSAIASQEKMKKGWYCNIFSLTRLSFHLFQDRRPLRARQIQGLLQAVQVRPELPQDQVRQHLLRSFVFPRRTLTIVTDMNPALNMKMKGDFRKSRDLKWSIFSRLERLFLRSARIELSDNFYASQKLFNQGKESAFAWRIRAVSLIKKSSTELYQESLSIFTRFVSPKTISFSSSSRRLKKLSRRRDRKKTGRREE